MPRPLRVALFCDSFHELNGVGTLCRAFAEHAGRLGTPMCCVRAGEKTRTTSEGSVTTIELKRGPSFPLDKDLYCDPSLTRYCRAVMDQLRAFQPDVIHITGPGDFGVLGFTVSNRLGVPLAASWHTNLHEYAGRRIEKALGRAPKAMRTRCGSIVERFSFLATAKFYGMAHFVMAPNQNMVKLLGERTGRPSYLMKHGVDTARFRPSRGSAHAKFRFGWVGRLTPEKNVRVFAEIEAQLVAAGAGDYEMLLVGDGSERDWLRKRLPKAIMPGFLQGEELALAFASMDAFVFPSQTDTFGLVILEALASGVPVILGAEAGERVGIQDGVTGYLSDNFTEGLLNLMRCPQTQRAMSECSGVFARTKTWDAVFDGLHEIYRSALGNAAVRRRMSAAAIAACAV